MAIQFRCPGCSQPIEVDDDYAGQTAACPYCRRVINVPMESTLDREGPVIARPTQEGVPDGEPPTGVRTPPIAPPSIPEGIAAGPPAPDRSRMARRLGNGALLCTVLTVLMFAAVIVYAVTQLPADLLSNPASQGSAERMADLEEKLSNDLWLGLLQLVGMFTALVGVALAITSLVQSRRGNWQAIVSLVICGFFVLCVCTSTAIAIASGLGTPA
jgi:DNA-directed RNA polymerase subunit RPC12/RpoP